MTAATMTAVTIGVITKAAERFRSLRSLCAFMAAFSCQTATQSFSQAKSERAPDHAAALGEASWHRRRSEHQSLLTNSHFNVCFIGDSLTEFWTHTGKAVWDAQLVPMKSANLGITADRTENIIYRIQNIDFRRANVRLFVVLMGTNNLGMEPPDKPEEVARAIISAARQLSTRHPQARVLVLGLPPSGDAPNSQLRQRIKQTNQIIEAAVLPARLEVLPLYQLFTGNDDKWRAGLTLDGTHFSAAGYARLAEALVPKLKSMLETK